MAIDISSLKESECKCIFCIQMCTTRPCWPLPEEAYSLISAGYANRLMADYWDIPSSKKFIIAPALEGWEGMVAPFNPLGRCAFLTADNLCELHGAGLKPIEGRIASCRPQISGYELHKEIAKKWDSNFGRMVVKKWFKKTRKK
jgi:hypothetical protein